MLPIHFQLKMVRLLIILKNKLKIKTNKPFIMKKQAIIVSIALAVTAISFGQKREVNRAQRAIKSEKYSDAQSLLNEAEKQITEMDDKLKAQFYAARAEVLTHTAGQDYNKMKTAAEAIE